MNTAFQQAIGAKAMSAWNCCWRPASIEDLEAIQKRTLAEGLPHQTLISSVLQQLRVRPAQGSLR